MNTKNEKKNVKYLYFTNSRWKVQELIFNSKPMQRRFFETTLSNKFKKNLHKSEITNPTPFSHSPNRVNEVVSLSLTPTRGNQTWKSVGRAR